MKKFIIVLICLIISFRAFASSFQEEINGITVRPVNAEAKQDINAKKINFTFGDWTAIGLFSVAAGFFTYLAVSTSKPINSGK